MRATGMPDWMVWIAVLQHASTGGKRTGAAGNRFRNAGKPQRQLRDDTERAFRTDHQPREIVAGGGLPGPPCGVDHLAIRQHDFERNDVVFHGAVAHGIGAGAARCGHAAERGIGAGIDRKEKSAVAQLLVERLARDAGLDDAIKILGMHREHFVHVAEIDRDTAARRIDVAFERCPHSEGNYRHAIGRANADDLLHLFGALRIDHGVRRLVDDPGDGIAMLLAHRLRRHDAVAERRRERRDQRP